MPLFLPYRSKTPWWAWLSGGSWLGAAIGSIVSGVTAGSAPASNSTCEKQFLSAAEAQTCAHRGRSVDRAIVLGATAAPLLTIPLVYLFRTDKRKPRASVIPSLGFGPTGGSLAFRGDSELPLACLVCARRPDGHLFDGIADVPGGVRNLHRHDHPVRSSEQDAKFRRQSRRASSSPLTSTFSCWISKGPLMMPNSSRDDRNTRVPLDVTSPSGLE